MRKLLTFLAIFLVGFGTSQLISFFRTPGIRLLNKSVEVTKEATATSVLTDKAREEARVSRVIDGDTIELEGGRKVRYIGIDTPEVVDPRKPVECFGKEAKEENRRLVDGRTVKLEKDVSEIDRYGRLLRYIYIGDVMINEALVRNGFAHASSYPPDVKNQERLFAAEREARENNRGLWGGCTSSTIQQFNNVTISPTVVGGSSSDCSIKGNISSKGEKIYHLPGCGSYNKTAIDESKGERWFCIEGEALSAGWRKAKNCP